MIASFDFDGTLDTPQGMAYAKELISRGITVGITTNRPPTFAKDVFKVARELGIHPSNILLCGIQKKKYFLEDIDYCFHLDNDADDASVARGVLFKGNFRDKCEELIEKYVL